MVGRVGMSLIQKNKSTPPLTMKKVTITFITMKKSCPRVWKCYFLPSKKVNPQFSLHSPPPVLNDHSLAYRSGLVHENSCLSRLWDPSHTMLDILFFSAPLPPPKFITLKAEQTMWCSGLPLLTWWQWWWIGSSWEEGCYDMGCFVWRGRQPMLW